jgi:hypothetical protein
MKLLFIFFSLLLIGFIINAQDVRYNYSNKISIDSLVKYVYTLASDSMEGRASGKPGQKKAAKYLSEKYKSMGLIPAGFFQDSILDPPVEKRFAENPFLQNHALSIKNNKEKNLVCNGESFLFGKDFIYPDIFQDSLLIINQFTFIGIGKKASPKDIIFSEKYNGKAVIVYDIKQNRQSFIINGDSLKKNQFAPAIVFVVSTPEQIAKDLLHGFQIPEHILFPVIFVSPVIAETILDKDVYEKFIRKVKNNSRLQEKVESVSLSVMLVSNTNELRGQNVIAYLPGKDPNGETIIISSHYDHLGIRDSAVFYGADDNASGTSAILEIARMFELAKKEGHGPKRSLLFLNVSGEEQGLYGSSWYVDHPAIGLKNTIADLNIDMIGRTDAVHDSTGVRDYICIIGSDKMSRELHTINENQNASGPHLELDYRFNSTDDPNRYYRRSDHYNFVKNGIPVIFYFDGSNRDYHKATDTPDKIDYELLKKRAQLVFLTAWELSNRNERIRLDNDADNDK